MPHVCTNCDRTFPDGSKEMLSGCPDCGGNKFQYRPAGGKLDAGHAEGSTDEAGGDTPTDTPPDPSPPRDPTGSRAAETVSSAASTLRDLVGGSADASEAGVPDRGTREPNDPNRNTADRSTPDRGADEPNAPDRDTADPPSNPEDDPVEPSPGGTAPDPVSTRSDGEVDPDADPKGKVDPDGNGEGGMAETEDAAQASARSSVVDPGEIEGGSAPASGDATGPGVGGTDAAPPASNAGGLPGKTSESPDADTDAPDANGDASAPEADADAGADESNLAELREELNDQFESIKIVEPGQYELNLMELYDRDEYIISLKEDGRYVIEVPETWRGNTP
jgi:predicted  nucleic acid-binding Zn-ribbon protein